uniref:Uncharacterized protein n=1 Tax=Myoviridae sp. ctwwN25 TaxID=2825209 RepID=A0A8S5PQ98_9CAUD|nr:MAG TPA: hypothetical protein [Myoviridae sp. ctwwN25]
MYLEPSLFSNLYIPSRSYMEILSPPKIYYPLYHTPQYHKFSKS